MNGEFPDQTSNTKNKRLLETLRKRLVETGTRNRLVHVNRNNSRSNALNIINERADSIFSILGDNAKTMRFRATGRDKTGAVGKQIGGLLEPVEASGGVEGFDERRFEDNFLETALGPEGLQKRLLRLAKDARGAEEEQGVNVLYLAIGFLTWFEDKSSAIPREAPLILLPVELKRNAKTSSYDLILRDDEINTNLPLQERLMQDFGLQLPELEVDGNGWRPSDYYDKVRQALASKTAWTIDENGMQLGFFSFAKLLMMKDLEAENWPEGSLENNPFIDGLLADGFTADAPIFGDEDKLDEKLKVSDLFHVIDADASQTVVIEEVLRGRNLVVQGPPGTGKSQTITNIIAGCIYSGKTVLFVAEKKAALDVVHGRLKSIGLGSICLELHSKKANKRGVLEALKAVFSTRKSALSGESSVSKLAHQRERLNLYSDLLHRPLNAKNVTPFEALSLLVKFKGEGVTPPQLSGSKIAQCDKSDIGELDLLLKGYAEKLKPHRARATHPLWGVQSTQLDPIALERLGSKISDALSAIIALIEMADKIAQYIVCENPTPHDYDKAAEFCSHFSTMPEAAKDYIEIFMASENITRLIDEVKIAKAYSQIRVELTESFVDAAWSSPIEHLRPAIAAGIGSFFMRLSSRYRAASRELASLLLIDMPKSGKDRLLILDELLSGREKKNAYENVEAKLEQTFQARWNGLNTDFDDILDVVTWLQQAQEIQPDILSFLVVKLAAKSKPVSDYGNKLGVISRQVQEFCFDISEVLELDSMVALGAQSVTAAPTSALKNWLQQLQAELPRYENWRQIQHTQTKLQKAHLVSLLDRMDKGDSTSYDARRELRYAWAETMWRCATEERPALHQLREIDRSKLVEDFQQLESSRIEEMRFTIASKHLESLPKGSSGEMGIIWGEIGRKRGHKPIRKLMQLAGNMIQRIKPVFLMSPLSIAQFIPPGTVEFDVLIIDEASQVRPEEAFGAVARCKQLVVVGDQKQLPPTSFFDRMLGDPDEGDNDGDLEGQVSAGDMESILSLCEARGIQRRMLSWHYRSRDPSLIAVSNSEFYDSRLILPPSPLEKDEDYGFMFRPVQGVYTPKSAKDGKPSTNAIEADKVVDAVLQHAVKTPELSLGIVTFSASQRHIIEEKLADNRRSNPQLDNFLQDGRAEDVFVKNIENVQGDERDVIFVSVGYGPRQPGGRLTSMSFGPINSDGGGRRLNVLFSRARMRCEIFCSFDPGDIDLTRTQKEGPRIFKRFLEFAKTGQLDQAIPTGNLAASPFEEDVMQAIQDLGYRVDAQVGSAGFRIDLGVLHPDRPGQYMLAVECDGATYHSALWARERDYLRQKVLEGLGWKFLRIWSTDWFYQRPQQIERLRKVLHDTAEEMREGISVHGANDGYKVPELNDLPTKNDDVKKDMHAEQITFVENMPALIAEPYNLYAERVQTQVEPHEVPMPKIAEILEAIIGVEGPIHADEIARRYAAAFGREKAGNRIVAVTMQGLTYLKQKKPNVFTNTGDFWATKSQMENPLIRNRSKLESQRLKAEYLPPSEILAAIQLIERESGKCAPDEMIKAVTKLFGFERAGPQLKAVIQNLL